MYQQVYDPVAGNLLLSTLVAVIPIVVLFVLLAGVRMAAQWAALITLAVALVIAVVIYGMPVGLALDSTLFGAAFGLFPIVWIVINAIFIYNIIVDTGLFDTPVAITGALMAGLGFEPIYAASLALLANTAPVAFGGFGIPILTAGAVSGLDPMELSQMVGRQGELRDAPAGTHALRLVTFPHHSRVVPDRADRPYQRRCERHADSDKLPERGGQRYDWIAG